MTMYRLYRLFARPGHARLSGGGPHRGGLLGQVYIGLNYIYTRLKVPSSMEVLRIATATMTAPACRTPFQRYR